MGRIGIYGGAFNPPHVGHIFAAEQAFRALDLSKLLLVPSNIPPHKQLPEGSADPWQRLAMLRIAAKDRPGWEVSDLEVSRPGTSYTYQTIRQLRQQYPDDELVLIMGTDMFLTFDHWVNPMEIAENASLAVMLRGSRGERSAVEEQMACFTARGISVTRIHNETIPVSSTQLRRLLAFRCASSLLPEGVGDYIEEHGLYQVGEDYRNLPMERLEKVVISLLNPNRVAHVLGCRDTAVAMARHWGADETDAARAGLLHDITKALDGPLQLTLCREYGTILDDFFQKYPKTLHALTGSLVAQRIFGENEAVSEAIRHHTTGKADMSLLEKIIYVADYMEPNRTLPYVEELRYLAFADIDAAVKLGLEMTLEHLATQNAEVSPATREALAWLNQNGNNHP